MSGAHHSHLCATDPPAFLAEVKRAPPGDARSGPARQLVQSRATTTASLKSQGDQEKGQGGFHFQMRTMTSSAKRWPGSQFSWSSQQS